MENDLIWLAHADRHIAASEQRVVEQRKRILELERSGRDSGEAVMLLSRMLEILNNYRRHRKLIIGQMAKRKFAELRGSPQTHEGGGVKTPKIQRPICAPTVNPATLASQVLDEIEQARARHRARALEELVEVAAKYRAESARADFYHALRLSQREDTLRQKVLLAYEAMKPKTRISAADVRMAEWSIKMRTLRATGDPISPDSGRKPSAGVDNVVRPPVWHRNASSE